MICCKTKRKGDEQKAATRFHDNWESDLASDYPKWKGREGHSIYCLDDRQPYKEEKRDKDNVTPRGIFMTTRRDDKAMQNLDDGILERHRQRGKKQHVIWCAFPRSSEFLTLYQTALGIESEENRP